MNQLDKMLHDELTQLPTDFQVPEELERQVWLSLNNEPSRHSPKKRYNERRLAYPLALIVGAILIIFLVFSNVNYVNDRLSSSHSKFDYHQYLAFDPLLPSETAGVTLTKSEITKITDQNGKVIAANYVAMYGKSFTIIEGIPSQVKVIYSGIESDIQLKGNVSAKMYKHDGRETIQFTKNGLLFNVTTINNHVSLNQLKQISESIHVKATQAPSTINASYRGSRSINHLSFNPIRPKALTIPQGYNLDLENSTINIVNQQTTETYHLVFRNKEKSGYSYLTIEQVKSANHDLNVNKSYKRIKVDGISVFIQQKNLQLPEAQFIEPKSKIMVTIYANLPTDELKQVINSILAASK